MQILPEKIWICPTCRAQFEEAWRLKRHLILTHDYSETRAWAITDRSVYFLRIVPREYVDEMDVAADRQSPKKDRRRRLGRR